MMRALLVLLTFLVVVPAFKGNVCLFVFPVVLIDVGVVLVLLQFIPMQEVGWHDLLGWLLLWTIRVLILKGSFQSSYVGRAVVLLALPLLYTVLLVPRIQYLSWNFYVFNFAFVAYVLVAILKIRNSDY
ncbi:hypothetical protein [Siphonobacter curvatus]|nr:hypothetical protein [Siphonobacter curvatus]